jgi:hypothetical protein
MLTIIPYSSIGCGCDKHRWIISHRDLVVIIYIFIKKTKTEIFILNLNIINLEMWQMLITHLYSQHDLMSICGDISFFLIETSSPWVVVEYRKEKKNQLRRVTSTIRMRIHFLSTSSKSISAFLDHCPSNFDSTRARKK